MEPREPSAPRSEVRRAQRADIPAITEIYNQAVLRTTATFDTAPKDLGEMEDWYDRHGPRHPVWVAVLDGRVVGYCSLTAWSDRPGYGQTAQTSIYLDEAHRGRGIGGRLLDALIEHADRAGLHALLAGIAEGGTASRRLHERRGFVRVGHLREVGYKQDRWLDVDWFERLTRPARVDSA